jgi:hypothetical protein
MVCNNNGIRMVPGITLGAHGITLGAREGRPYRYNNKSPKNVFFSFAPSEPVTSN